MIGYIKGNIITSFEGFVIVDVQGVGYKINYLGGNLEKEVEVEMFVYTHVRENEISLYGFSQKEELEIFEKLIGVSGIGPKSALTMVGQLGVNGILDAISTEDPNGLKVSGVGQKTAQKIILELSGKVEGMVSRTPNISGDTFAEVNVALQSLGYSETEIREALRDISIDDQWRSEDIIKSALAKLRK